MDSPASWLLSALSPARATDVPLTPPASWTAVEEVADAWRLTPALALAVRTSGTPVPPAIQKRLERSLGRARGRHVVFGQTLAGVLRAFAVAGIPVIVLKGAVLAETLYPDPAARPYYDVDILVRPADRFRADARLRELGFVPFADAHSNAFDLVHDTSALYVGVSGVQVDLHWSPLNAPHFAWDGDEAVGVWERTVPVVLADVPARALAPEDQLLTLAAHLAVHHALVGVVWYLDLAFVLARWGERTDWARVAARARRWRVSRALAFALCGAEARFGVRVPAAGAPSRAARGPRAALLRSLLARRPDDETPRLEHVVPLLLMDRGRDVLPAVARALVPAPAWISARYPDAPASLAARYLAHYRRLAGLLRVSTLPRRG